MKKTTASVLIIFFSLLSYIAQSQTLWVNGGITKAEMSLVYTSKFGSIDRLFELPKNTFNGSLEFEYSVKEKRSLSTEFGTYLSSGEHNFPSFKSTLTIPYIYAQELFNYYPISFKSFRLHIAAGPRFEFVKVDSKDHIAPLYFLSERVKVLNKFNAGITGKIGLEFQTNGLSFRADIVKPWKFLKFATTDEGQDLSYGNNLDLLDITGTENIWLLNFGIGFQLSSIHKAD